LLHLVGALGRRYRFGGGFELRLVVLGNVYRGVLFLVFRDGRRGRHHVGRGRGGDVGRRGRGRGRGHSGRGYSVRGRRGRRRRRRHRRRHRRRFVGAGGVARRGGAG